MGPALGALATAIAARESGLSPYTYDTNGNLTSAGPRTFTWSYNNFLTAVSGTGTSTYSYDHAGQRVLQIGGGATSTYPSRLFSVATTTNNKGTSTEYIYAGNDLIATIEGTSTASAVTRYVHPDHLGSTNVVSDSNKNAVQTLDYYPYGGTRIDSGTDVSQREFIGQFLDEQNGLSYLNARYYESTRGQFLSQDPVFWEVGQTRTGRAILQNPQLLNSYAYAAGNPITGKDADGRLVELVSRPVSLPLGVPLGAHAFIAVIPENAKTIGSIPGVDVSKPFTLGGYTDAPSKYNLYKAANESTDYGYAFGGNTQGVAQAIVVPPTGVSQEEFERRIVESYNTLPGTISSGSYGFMGQKRLTGNPNSNNVATDILLGAGVTPGQVNSYQSNLYAQNLPRITPGLGTSASARTYGQSLNATLNSLKGALTRLLGVLGSKKGQ